MALYVAQLNGWCNRDGRAHVEPVLVLALDVGRAKRILADEHSDATVAALWAVDIRRVS
jgi:hypothetical protein